MPGLVLLCGESLAGISWGSAQKRSPKKYGHLSVAQVYAALTYYHANREEIDADLTTEDKEAERLEREYYLARKSLLEDLSLTLTKMPWIEDLIYALRIRGVDIMTAPEADMIERNDQEHLGYAAAQGRTLYGF